MIIILSFFPSPYPDEILYSVLARYHVRSGNTSPKVTMKELFNTQGSTATIDMPCNVDSLIKNMPINACYTSEILIENNTLYPFYAPFLPVERAKKILKSMKGNYGGDIHTRAGIMASSIETFQYLRFCPICLSEDVNHFGEPYWHRIHQIPGYYICHKHRQLVLNSNIFMKALNKHEFYPAGMDNCDITLKELLNNDIEIQKFLDISRDIEWILNSNLISKKMDWFFERYKVLIIEKGLANENGRVDQESLINEFLNYYGENLLNSLQSNPCGRASNWLSSIVRKPRKTFHPIRHILTINFLSGSIEDFFREKCGHKVFGTPPWPCLNSAAEHYHQSVINDLKITIDSHTKQPVGTFICSCGFVFSRRGPDEDEVDRYHYGRVKAFGPIWENKLACLLQDKALSLREIARRLNVDVKTIKKYVERIKDNAGLSNKFIYKVMGNNINEETDSLRENYRTKWLILQRDSPELSKNELRKKAKAVYMWLYRHDKAWINVNSPKKIMCFNENKRVDWEERDFEIMKNAIKIVAETLNSIDKPERITINMISKKIGMEALISKHIDKLPKTKEYLASAVENHEQYQIRRIKWAAAELNKQGQELKEWKLLRTSGIKKCYSNKIKVAIDKEIETYSNLQNNYEEKRN